MEKKNGECHIALSGQAGKKARRKKEMEGKSGEKETVSQTEPLTRDTHRAYKVHNNATARKEKKRKK